MSAAQLSKEAFALPPEERLDLARRLVEIVIVPFPLSEVMEEGIRRIEDMATGRVKPLTEEEYQAALE